MDWWFRWCSTKEKPLQDRKEVSSPCLYNLMCIRIFLGGRGRGREGKASPWQMSRGFSQREARTVKPRDLFIISKIAFCEKRYEGIALESDLSVERAEW